MQPGEYCVQLDEYLMQDGEFLMQLDGLQTKKACF